MTNEQRELEIKLNAQQANASIKEMGAGVALLTNQLQKMAQDDPRRAALKRDFDVLTERVGAARKELRTYAQTEDEVRLATEKLNRENTQVILNGQKLNSSFKDLTASSGLLKKQLEEMNGDDPGRKKLLADYHALQDRLAGISTEMKGATQGTSFLKQGFANAFALFAGGGLIGLAQQLFGFFSASREEFLSSAKSSADLEATLAATKHAAGLTAAEIRKIGEERAKVTLFDDDETNRASAMLLTFKNVKKGVFEEAIPAIQDLATKMAGDGPADMKGASIQLGKALNDPITGVTKLTKVGVTFTEQQKEQIAAMVKAGDTAGAQRVILSELNSEFGGSAEAARKAGGGVATLTMRFNEFKETVGGKVSGVLDSLSQWLGRVVDKAQPLLDMVSALGDEFMAYYHDISDIVESLGLFNEKTDTAQLVINGLKYALTVLLLPLKGVLEISKAIVGGFTDWYNKSELLRGVLGGLGAVVVSLFTTIKDDALKILGGVGDILVGIFTLDKNKIIAGFKAALSATADVMLEGGNKAADAFAKGYEANKNNHITRTVRVKTEETTSATGGTAAVGEETPAGESAAAKKAREAAEKKAKAARDKADQERLNALKDWIKEEGSLLDARDLRNQVRDTQALSDEERRRFEQQQKLYDAATKQVNALTGLEADYTEQVAAIVEERERKLRELQDKFNEEDKKKREAILDQRLKDVAADEQVALAELEVQLANKKLTHEQYEEAVFKTKSAARDKELALVKLRNGEESVEYKKLLAEKLKEQAAHTTKSKHLDDDVVKFKKALGNAEKVLNDDNVKWLEDSLGKQTIAYQAFKMVRKADALANIGIALYEEIQQYWEDAAGMGPIAGPVYGVAMSGLAVVRQGAAAAKIVGFEKGGPTGEGLTMARPAQGGLMEVMRQATGMGVASNGKLTDAAGLEVAGIVHKNEYVIPEWMRQDPQVLQVENWLEARRQRGFVDGGPTTDGDRRASAVPTAPAAADNARLVQVLASLDQRLQGVEQWATQLEVVQDVLGLDRQLTTVKTVQQKSAIRTK